MTIVTQAPVVTPTELVGAVDVGGTKIAVGLLDRRGGVVARRNLKTGAYASGAAGLAAIRDALLACLSDCGADLCGIGIACTGPVDPLTGVVGRVANLPGWEGLAVTEELTQMFGVDAAMENDADAAAIAEVLWGVGRDVERFLYLTLSTGIGAGLVLDGKIYRGKGGAHPELGHHSIDPGGPLCYCGARGCWESLASGLALRDWFVQNDPQRCLAHGEVDARYIFALYDQGDALARKAVARLSRYVGIGLANVTTMLVPDVIAIGGGLMSRADAFLPAAEAYFRSTCGEVPAENTRICAATRGENSGLAGAAAVWLSAARHVKAVRVAPSL